LMGYPTPSIWVMDTEYQSDGGDRPKVVCLCARELNSGDTIRMFREDLLSWKYAPFDVGKNSIVVAYYAPAELSCFLALGWPLPYRVIDLFVEHRVSTNGRKFLHPHPDSLLGAAMMRGIHSMDAEVKDANRELIMSRKSLEWSEAERETILNYCMATLI
jgi:DNA polymerase I